MSEAKVILKGHISVPADRLAQVRDALPEHIALTRAEPGCLSFDVEEEAAVPGRFNVSEVFASQVAFDAHQARTKASVWFEVTKGIPRDYAITTE
ncbi:putative quinol monooxygenase [Ruegeria sp. Ofav3-42]|uniref:putative quinol monooxygenase n=1 Tax=Ruegeria sp. Ofav3-42 TaxID=2917759 RepID=UPI001EF629A0|nr:antibiotic biosynthesis monooxygenase [Ruegeria sp. Ofav3-42]MCG7518120.1 antibiotic biosynthesis monooxygenase [Ruegeria sp. Ofav3-42]